MRLHIANACALYVVLPRAPADMLRFFLFAVWWRLDKIAAAFYLIDMGFRQKTHKQKTKKTTATKHTRHATRLSLLQLLLRYAYDWRLLVCWFNSFLDLLWNVYLVVLCWCARLLVLMPHSGKVWWLRDGSKLKRVRADRGIWQQLDSRR